MKCPNCLFEVQGAAEVCPFCNAQIPQDLDAAPSDSTVGAPLDPLAPPIPSPGGADPVPTPGMATPDAVPLEGTLDPSAPTLHEDAPAPAPSGGGATAGALKLALIAGGGFLAFKLGLLDNLLAVAGLSSAPSSEPTAAAPVPMPEPEPVPMPEPAPVETPRPGQSGPVAAPAEPAAPAPAPAPAEWVLEGKVTDILTMKPVRGAVFLFMTQAEDETYEAKSDAQGRWSVKVPPRKDGYKLFVDHPEYISEYFDETDPPYKTWTMAKRRQLRAAKPAHKPWVGGAATVRRDVLLFPDITDR